MKIGGYDTRPDHSRLGTALLVGACVILAVRTARWPNRSDTSTASDRDLEAEVDHSILLARRVLSHLLARQPDFFPSKQVAWYEPDETDVLK